MREGPDVFGFGAKQENIVWVVSWNFGFKKRIYFGRKIDGIMKLAVREVARWSEEPSHQMLRNNFLV